jgi:hypothetical protein
MENNFPKLVRKKKDGMKQTLKNKISFVVLFFLPLPRLT